MKKLILFLALATACFGQAQPGVRMVVCTDAGANDTYTCTAAPTVASYTAGMMVKLTVNTANTGAATLNIDSVGAKNVVKIAGGISTTLADNDLVPKGTYILVYNATDDNFKVISATGAAASGGTTHQIFMNLAGNTVASTTSYAGPSAASFGTETARTFMVTRDTTFTKMYLRTSGTQGACDATVTLRNTSTAADTTITLTITNGATTQTWSDTAHTADFTAGQRAVVKVASTGCTSATITEISLEYN